MKKKYTIVTVISMLIGVADFIFLGCVSDEFFSENAAFVIFIFLAVLLLLIAILKITEKKYYNDAKLFSKVSRNGLFMEIIDQLYNRNIIKKSTFFPGGRFLPIIYSILNNQDNVK